MDGSHSSAEGNICIDSVSSYWACEHHVGNVMQLTGIGEKEEECFKFLKIKLFLYTAFLYTFLTFHYF
jgi:hypothetical protein